MFSTEDKELASLATDHYSVFTLVDATKAGLTESQVRNRAANVWVRLHDGVFATPGAALTWRSHYYAATCARRAPCRRFLTSPRAALYDVVRRSPGPHRDHVRTVEPHPAAAPRRPRTAAGRRLRPDDRARHPRREPRNDGHGSGVAAAISQVRGGRHPLGSSEAPRHVRVDDGDVRSSRGAGCVASRALRVGAGSVASRAADNREPARARNGADPSRRGHRCRSAVRDLRRRPALRCHASTPASRSGISPSSTKATRNTSTNSRSRVMTSAATTSSPRATNHLSPREHDLRRGLPMLINQIHHAHPRVNWRRNQRRGRWI